MLPVYTDEDMRNASLLNFRRQAALSRECGNELLRLIHSLDPLSQVPSDWRTIMSYQKTKCQHLKDTTLRQVVPYPDDWRMDLFFESGHPRPVEIELIGRDLLELVAYKLVDPTLQYIHSESLQYEYKAQTMDDGTPCYSNLMSSRYAKYTEEDIRRHDPQGILVPIIVYADGVALGVRNKVCTKCYDRLVPCRVRCRESLSDSRRGIPIRYW
jgi:hypothetical protein